MIRRIKSETDRPMILASFLNHFICGSVKVTLCLAVIAISIFGETTIAPLYHHVNGGA
jgi:hypothetical protein